MYIIFINYILICLTNITSITSAFASSASKKAMPPDVVSKCIVCCISAYDKLKPLKGAAIDFQHALDAVKDLECETVTTKLTDRVKCSELQKAFNHVVRFFETSEDLPDFPVFLALISCHGIQKGDKEFPHLLGSDAPADEGAWSLGVDVEEFVNKLRAVKFRAKNVKKLRAILVLDCCRADLPVAESRGVRDMVRELQDDIYIIFSCDKGSTSLELGQRGGALMRELLPSLKYEKSICDIFLDACTRVTCQRPNISSRPNAHDIPVLGRKKGDPPGWTVGKRRDLGDDRDMGQLEAPHAAEVQRGSSRSAESSQRSAKARPKQRPGAKAQASRSAGTGRSALAGFVFNEFRQFGSKMQATADEGDDQGAQVFMRAWNSGLNYMADQAGHGR